MAELARWIAVPLLTGQTCLSERDTIEIALRGSDRADLATTLDAIAAPFRSEVDFDGELRRVHVAIGAAIASAMAADATAMIEEAEIALAEAQTDGPPLIRDAAQASLHRDPITGIGELTEATARGEFVLHYQPKIHVRRQEVASLEALIRWRHPTRGLIYPNDFIPEAEETSAIVPMTLWTIRQVIADQRVLAAHGHLLPIFINIAGILLANDAFVRDACELVRESGAQVGFEVTETSVIRDPERAIANLKVFADLGIVIAIDDYGAGLSSLAYMKRLPARELKIDKLFVTQLTSSNRDPLIVRSTIDLAHAMEMEVVAEGVETPAALALLSVMGCDMVQGFLISRPVAIDAIIAFLDQDCATMFDNTRMTFGKLAESLKRTA